MKIQLLSLTVFLLTVSCSTETESIVSPTPAPAPTPVFMLPAVEECGFQSSSSDVAGWNLIFEDNFDKDFITNWTPWSGGAFNNELQFYRSTNVFVENDLLYIYGKKTAVTGRTNPFDETSKSFDYASGRLESRQEFGPDTNTGNQEVRFSARIRLVEGHGLWPAWWSYNDPWPTKGEIDILEARGNTPNEFQSNFHFGVNTNELQTNPVFNEFKYENSDKLSDCFHVYELEWSKEAFTILFDGEVVKKYDSETFEYVDDFFGKKHRLVLNLAIGGDFFSNLDLTQIPDESFLVVDWVRVYAR